MGDYEGALVTLSHQKFPATMLDTMMKMLQQRRSGTVFLLLFVVLRTFQEASAACLVPHDSDDGERRPRRRKEALLSKMKSPSPHIHRRRQGSLFRLCCSSRNKDGDRHDLSRPVFDLCAFRSVRGDALTKCSSLNQSANRSGSIWPPC
jgi:hypothetical protein